MIYYFIEDLTEIDPTSNIEISENLVLKSIPAHLQNALKDLIKRYSIQSSLPFGKNEFVNSYHEFKLVNTYSSGGVNINQRKPEDFRYIVLEESNVSKYNLIYPKAFELSSKDYFMPFAFSSHDNGFSIRTSFSELCIFTYYNDLNIIMPYSRKNNETINKKAPKDFEESDKLELLENIKLLTEFENIKKQFPSINKALQDFFLSREISDYSVFKIIAYISCLEMLLVDSGPEKLKSINFQLQTKVNLLNNQFDSPIDFKNYIKGPDKLTFGKVVETIYDYRSSIAHGNFLDFQKKLQILERVSEINILRFIRDILKKSLIFALKNPQLVSDLKKC